MIDVIDLEYQISDLRYHAFVCRELVESKIRHTPHAPATKGYHTIILNDDELSAVMFMVIECESRARMLDERIQKDMAKEEGARQ